MADTTPQDEGTPAAPATPHPAWPALIAGVPSVATARDAYNLLNEGASNFRALLDPLHNPEAYHYTDDPAPTDGPAPTPTVFAYHNMMADRTFLGYTTTFRTQAEHKRTYDSQLFQYTRRVRCIHTPTGLTLPGQGVYPHQCGAAYLYVFTEWWAGISLTSARDTLGNIIPHPDPTHYNFPRFYLYGPGNPAPTKS